MSNGAAILITLLLFFVIPKLIKWFDEHERSIRKRSTSKKNEPSPD